MVSAAVGRHPEAHTAVPTVGAIVASAIQDIIKAGGHGVISISIEPVSRSRDEYRAIVTPAPSILVKFCVKEGQTQPDA